MSITVILAPFIGPLGARVNSEPPGKSMDRQIFTNFWHILAFFTHLE